MNPLLPKNLISIKEASELSGYNPDYLARLARSGDVEGVRVGRTWLVGRESLVKFLKIRGRSQKELVGLISTKEASKEFGYNPDYLARLARSGEVEGTRVGRTWLVKRESLATFLAQQAERKEAHARALARAREEEYRERQIAAIVSPVQIAPVTREISEPKAVWAGLRSQAFAFSVAVIVISSAALVAQGSAFSKVSTQLAALGDDFMYGFAQTFGEVPSRLASRVNKLSLAPSTSATGETSQVGGSGAHLEFPRTLSDVLSLRAEFFHDDGNSNSAPVAVSTLSTVPLMSAQTARSLATGEVFVTATHAVIRVYSEWVYRFVKAAPESISTGASLALDTGDFLLDVTARTPVIAARIFSQTVEEPVFAVTYSTVLSAVRAKDTLLAILQRKSFEGLATIATGSVTLSRASLSQVATAVLSASSRLSIGERTALFTYHTIRDFFTATERYLALWIDPTNLFSRRAIVQAPVPTSSELSVRTSSSVAVASLLNTTVRANQLSFANPVLSINAGLVVRDNVEIGGSATLSGALRVSGATTLSGSLRVADASSFGGLLSALGGIDTGNADINAGTGRVFASNLINSITAGANITITGTAQNPIISAKRSGGGGGGGSTGLASIGISVPDFLSVSGSPLTANGTLSITYAGTALPAANGGTGSTTLSGILVGNNTSAVQTLLIGAGLSFDGATLTNTGGGGGGGSGTVTSINASGGTTGLSFSGGPVTTSGTLTLSGTLNIANGGTGLSSITGNRLLYTNAAGTALLEVATSSSSFSIGGNAATATIFETARTINGTSFNGSANITITAASSTLLADSNTFSGTNTFSTLPILGTLTGLIAGNNGILYQTASSTLFGTGTGGYVLAWSNGTPTWVATSSINNGVSSLAATYPLITSGSTGAITLSTALSTTTIAQTYGSGQLGAVTFATSSQTTNGQTVGLNITNIGGAFTFAPTISGTLGIAGGGTGQSTFTSSQLLYGNGTNALSSVATTTLAFSSFPANLSGTLGTLVGGTNSSLAWWGLATTTNVVAGNLFYGSGANGVANVATTTATLASEFSYSGTLGSLVGGANGTLSLTTNGVALNKLAQIAANTILGNPTGAAGNVTAFATSTLGIALGDTTGTLSVARGGTGQTTFTASQLLYGNGTNGLTSVATTSLAFSGPFTGASSLGALVGGSNSTIVYTGLATTSQPSSSNLLVSNGGAGVYGVSTTTASCSGAVSCSSFSILGSAPVTITSSAATFAWPFTPATNFGVNTSATTTALWAQVGLFASSSSAYPTLAVSQAGAGAAATFMGGNVGIGTTSPWGTLGVNGVGQAAGAPSFVVGSSTKTDFIITQSGNVGVGTTSPMASLAVSGRNGLPAQDNAIAARAPLAFAVYGGTGGYYGAAGGGRGADIILQGGIGGTPGGGPTDGGAGGDIYIAGGVGGVGGDSTGTTGNVILANGVAGYSQGKVGVGSTTPWGTLSVNGASQAAGVPSFVVGSSTKTDFIVTQQGNVGIGTTSPYALLSIVGPDAPAGTVQLEATPVLAIVGGAGSYRSGGGNGGKGSGVSIIAGTGGGSTGDDGGLGGDITLSAGNGGSGNTNDGNGGSLYLNGGTGNFAGNIILANLRGHVGIGTTTPTWLLNPYSATASQLSLSAGAGFSQWAFRNAGGTFYLATTTIAGTATSTTAALSISSNTGAVTFGNAAATCIALTGSAALCDGDDATGAGGAFPFTPATNFGVNTSATTTALWAQSGLFASSTSVFANATTSQLTVSGTTWFGSLTNALLSTNASGQLVATTSIGVNNLALPKGNFLVGNDAGVAQATSSIFISSTGNVGIGDTNPTSRLRVSDSATDVSNTTISVGSDVSYNTPGNYNNYGINATINAIGTENNVGTLTGIYSDALNYLDSGVIGRVIGGRFTALSSATAGITNAYGSYSSAGSNNTGAYVTNAYGSYADVIADNGGTVATGYGLYLGTIAATTNYGLYSSDATADSYFAGSVGIATTTPARKLTISDATSPQLMLTDASNTSTPWNFRSINGSFYLATSSPTTFATSTTAALTINGSTSAVTFGNAAATCIALTGSAALCDGDDATGAGGAFPFTPATNFGVNTSATTTALWGQAGIFASSSSAYPTLAVSQAGAGAAATFMGGKVGIGTTSPWGLLSVNPNALAAGVPSFVVGSSTATNFIITQGGNVGIGTTSPNGYTQAGKALSIVSDSFSALELAGNTGVVGSKIGSLSFMNLENGAKSGGVLASISALIGGNGTLFTDDISLTFSTHQQGGSLSERMRITNTGNVGIGTTTAWGLLSVNPSALAAGVPSFVVGSSTDTKFIITQGGNVGIGTTNPTAYLHVIGAAGAAGATGANAQDTLTVTGGAGGASSADNTPGTGSHVSLTAGAGGNRGAGLGGGGTGGNITLVAGAAGGGWQSGDPGDVIITGGAGAAVVTNVIGNTGGLVTLTGGAGSSGNGFGGDGYGMPGGQITITGGAGGNGALAGYSGNGASVVIDGGAPGTGGTGGVPLAGNVLLASTRGLVGIGTSTPKWALTIASSTAPQLALSAGAGIAQWVFRSAGGNLYIGTSSPTTFATSTFTTLSIVNGSQSGRVGIGSTSPTHQLSVHDTVNSTYVYTATGALFGQAGVRMSAGGSEWQMDNVGLSGGLFSTPNNRLRFYGPNGEAMTMTSGNEIGIGTSSPARNLTISDSGESQLMLTDGSTTSSPWNFRSAGDNLYIATSSASTFATTTSSALTILGSNGYVGIGTSTPRAKFAIEDIGATGANRNVMTISTSSVGYVFRVDAYGKVWWDTAGGASADYAEYFRTNSVGLKSGEVVCVDVLNNNSVKRCERGADSNVMGIVSTKPLILGNDTQAVADDPARHAAIGMLGQVDAFVSAENGPVNVGDSLTSASSTPGYAMRASGGDSTVGVALEPLAAGKGKIKVLISRRNKSLAVEQVESLVTDRIAGMKIEDRVNQMVAASVEQMTTLPQLAVTGTVLAGSFQTIQQPLVGYTLGATTTVATLPSEVLTVNGAVDIYKLATYNLSAVEALAARQEAMSIRVDSLEVRLAMLESGAVSTASGTPSSLVAGVVDGIFNIMGLLKITNDGFAGSIMTNTEGVATITFDTNVGTGKPVVELTVEGDTLAFAQIQKFEKDSEGNYTGFTIKAVGLDGTPASVAVHYFVVAKGDGFTTIEPSTPTTAPSGGDTEVVTPLPPEAPVQTDTSGETATTSPATTSESPLVEEPAPAEETSPEPVVIETALEPLPVDIAPEPVSEPPPADTSTEPAP